jgi:hypothetical protein
LAVLFSASEKVSIAPRIATYPNCSHSPERAQVLHGRVAQIGVKFAAMTLELNDAELATAATACRAMAYQETERAKKMETRRCAALSMPTPNALLFWRRSWRRLAVSAPLLGCHKAEAARGAEELTLMAA